MMMGWRAWRLSRGWLSCVPSVADLFQSKAVLDARLTRPSSAAANMGDHRDQRRKVPSFWPPQSKTNHDGENYDGESMDA